MKKYSFLIYYLLFIGIGTARAQFTDLLNFYYSTSKNPIGSLTLSGNILYGLTTDGGAGYGTVFSVHTNGSNYKDLLDFNVTNGATPEGSLTLSGGVLYGMTN